VAIEGGTPQIPCPSGQEPSMFTLPPLIWWGLPYGVVQVVQVVLEVCSGYLVPTIAARQWR